MVVKTKKVLETKKNPLRARGSVSVLARRRAVGSILSKKNLKKVSVTAKNESPIKKRTSLALNESSKAKDSKVSIVDNTKRVTEVVKRISIYPSIQSSFRFPLPSTKVVSVLANSFGMVFVLIGAFFSLMHVSENIHTASYNALSNLAMTIDSAQLISHEPLSEMPGTISGTESDLITKPVPHISTTPVGKTSSGISIMVTVALAQEVKVLLSNSVNSQLYALGSALNADPSTWKIYWDTAKYPAGEYKIKLLVKNSYGSYEYNDTNTITIEDITRDEAVLDTTAQDLKNSEPEITLSISEDNPVDGSVSFEISVQNATAVRIGLKNTQSASLYSVGYLTKKDDSLWNIVWNSRLVPDGTYVLTPKVIIEGVKYNGNEEKLVVKNGVIHSDTIPATTTRLNAEPVPEKTEPVAQISLGEEGKLKGFVDISITTSPVDTVELFVIPLNALTPQFIGLAQKESETKWKFLWQTGNSPNGEYYLFARIKSLYGVVDAGKIRVEISNTSMDEFTNEQEGAMDTLRDVSEDLIRVTEEDASDDGELSEGHKVAYVEPVSKFVATVDVDEGVKIDMEKTLDAFRIALYERLSLLAKAKREGDEEALRQAEADIEMLRKEVLSTLPKSIEKKEIIEEISMYLSQVTFELSEVTIKNETLLRERVGGAIMNDSDKDEISDYDEINLYKTNPFSADSDNDGYNDNSELVSGFDPLDSKTEAVVAYESPKEVGIVREDLLIVSAVTPIEKVNVEEQPKGLISGKALPNSFVTLYIYSTPVVVTVKTDSEGNWNYIFDKELEDGEHEVYVGITNNQGKIVAKSNPLPFVKTAEAFAGVTPEASAATIADAEPSLINTDSLLTIASMIVLILGIVLLFLGFHLKKEDVMTEQPLAV